MATALCVDDSGGMWPMGYWTAPWPGENSFGTANIRVDGHPVGTGVLMHQNTLFSDSSIRKYADRTNQFAQFHHFEQDSGMLLFTGLLH